MTASFPRCPREDCTETHRHFHSTSRISPCPSGCGDPWRPDHPSGCVDPRLPVPPVSVVIPEATIEDLQRARVHLPASTALSSGGLAQLLEADRAYLRDLLDVWAPVPDGHTIPTGTLTRREYGYGIAAESPYQPLPPVEGVLLLVRASDLDKLTPPTPEPTVEMIAAAMRAAMGVYDPLDLVGDDSRRYWFDQGQLVLDAMEASGWTVEPKPREDAS